MSAGTLYPMLHGLERKGYLKSRRKRFGRTYRRFYRATPLGRKALTVVRLRLNELFDEVAVEEVAERAAKRALGKLKARPAPSGVIPVGSRSIVGIKAPYRPLKTGARFSKKAATPSR